MHVVLTLSLLASGAKTEPVATPKRIELTAQGGLRIDLDRHVGVASGDVTIKRDDILVCCDQATVRYSDDRIESVECRGRVTIVRPDGTQARADVAVFEAKRDRVTLSGDAKVHANRAELSGDTIVYDIGLDKLDVQGPKSRFRYAAGNIRPLRLERACPP